jgi:hypothetical protein
VQEKVRLSFQFRIVYSVSTLIGIYSILPKVMTKEDSCHLCSIHGTELNLE